MLLRDVQSTTRSVKAYESGALVRTLQPWTGVDEPTDEFIVEIGGELLRVRRSDIGR